MPEGWLQPAAGVIAAGVYIFAWGFWGGAACEAAAEEERT